VPSEQQDVPLGYHAACEVVRVGYKAMFQGCEQLIPQASDLALKKANQTPQFGFVGPRYAETRVLVLGVNPGVVKRDKVKERDQPSLDALRSFRDEPTPGKFLAAQAANRIALESWRDENRHWKHLLARTSLTFDDIAFSNGLPWRTSTNELSSQLQLHAAAYYAWPLVKELAPRLVICFGCNAAQVFEPRRRRVRHPKDVRHGPPQPLPPHVVWRRSRKRTAEIERQNASALAQINATLNGRWAA